MFTFRPFETSSVWKIPDPDRPTHTHTGTTRAELVSNIQNYRAQNGLKPIENLNIVLDNYLCSLPENQGKCRPYELRRGLLQYLKGGIALVSNLFYGEKNMVSQETADLRSGICKECKFNIFPDRDMFITWSDEIAMHSTGNKKSRYHSDLGNCEACSCCLKAKVWMKGPISLSAEEVEMMGSSNVTCWQLAERKGK